MNITESFDDVGTFGAYHCGYEKFQKFYIFKYFNIHLWPGCTLNDTKDVLFLNYSYLVVDGMLIKENGIGYFEIAEDESSILTLEGTNLLTNEDTDYKFKLNDLYLIKTDDSEFRTEQWARSKCNLSQFKLSNEEIAKKLNI